MCVLYMWGLCVYLCIIIIGEIEEFMNLKVYGIWWWYTKGFGGMKVKGKLFKLNFNFKNK